MKQVLPDVSGLAEAVGKSKLLAAADFKNIWSGATKERLFLTDATKDSFVATDWCDIARVSLKDGRVTIYFADTTQPVSLTVENQAEAMQLLTVINELVTASAVTSGTLKTPNGQVTVSIRRRPSGKLFSQVLANESVNLEDTEIRRHVVTLENELRQSVGLA